MRHSRGVIKGWCGNMKVHCLWSSEWSRVRVGEKEDARPVNKPIQTFLSENEMAKPGFSF